MEGRGFSHIATTVLELDLLLIIHTVGLGTHHGRLTKKLIQTISSYRDRWIIGIYYMKLVESTLLSMPEPACISETLELLREIIPIEIGLGTKGAVELVKMRG
jgi:hypothetical protein